MLQRHKRARSPAPSSSDVPLITEPPMQLDKFNVREPKRRRVEHSDTQLGSRWQPSDDEVYDEQEDPQAQPNQELNINTEYKKTNSVLYEVHALNQHRLIFSTTPEAHLRLAAQTAAYSQHPERSIASASATVPSSKIEEVQRVTERYEGANKHLGSLFLSRRRDLNSRDESSGT